MEKVVRIPQKKKKKTVKELKLNYSILLGGKVSNTYIGMTMQYSQLISNFKNQGIGASLVAQLLRIHLPMQGTWVRALVWEDPTCHGATGPVSHNY